MEAVLKRYFWVIRWAAIAVVVGYAASVVVTVVGRRLLLDEGVAAYDLAPVEEAAEAVPELEDDPAASVNRTMQARASESTGSKRARDKQMLGATIIARNIFCPTCRPPEPVADPSAGVQPGDPLHPDLMVEIDPSQALPPGTIKSSLPLVLVATMEADDPLYSMATIADTERGTLGPYLKSDVIRPGVTMELVQRGRVILKTSGRLEYVAIGEPPAPPPAVKPVVEEEAKTDDGAIPGADEAIKCATEDNCVIERAFVEQLLVNPAALAKQARVVPSIKDGETQGFKFYGIRNGSLPKLLGLKNGDLVTDVNGQKLGSLDDAMGLYNKLRNASNLSVTVERKGQIIVKEIEIK